MADTQPGPDVAQLVAEHHQAVYRYAYRLTGSVHDAEDLTQQVFLIAQRKMGQLRKMGSARGLAVRHPEELLSQGPAAAAAGAGGGLGLEYRLASQPTRRQWRSIASGSRRR